MVYLYWLGIESVSLFVTKEVVRMGDVLMADIDITTLIAASSVLVVLSIQLLLCFKTKRLLLRLLPLFVLTASTVFLFIMMRITTDWGAIGYAILFVFSGVLLAFSGMAWGIWAIIKLIKGNTRHSSNSNLSS